MHIGRCVLSVVWTGPLCEIREIHMLWEFYQMLGLLYCIEKPTEKCI